MSSGNMTPELSSPDGSFRPSLANSSGGVDSGRSLDVPNGPSLPTLNSIPSPAEASAFDKPRESDSRREKTRKRGSRTKKGNNDATEQMSTVKWQNLQNLQNLMNAGFITGTEYKERKIQLIDGLTGTTFGTTVSSSVSSTRGGSSMRRTSSNTSINITPKPPPDFASIQTERATKFVYDLAARKWNKSAVVIKLDTVPFSQGALRLVYHLMEIQDVAAVKAENADDDSDVLVKQEKVSYVAKISKDPRDASNREIYFRDVEMQSVAKYYAKQFNEYDPPKKVDFVKAWLLQLDDRQGAPICGVERFIVGPYLKHNNNFGFVNDDDRNTPQAFSHFTYESSKQRMLVVDIQGVSDLYTDPQVHSVDTSLFGKGNLGQRGIDKYISTHRCNAICRYLKLPSINADYSGLGTLPMTQYMNYERVQLVNVGSLPALNETRPDEVNARTPLIADHEGTKCAWCSIL